MAVYDGIWIDPSGDPFDDEGTPQPDNPQGPTVRPRRRRMRRHPNQDICPNAVNWLTHNEWHHRTQIQKDFYGPPAGGMGPNARDGAALWHGGFSFYVHANIGNAIHGFEMYIGSTNKKFIPVSNFHLEGHIPAQQGVDLCFDYWPDHPPFFEVYTDITIAQVDPIRASWEKPDKYSRVFDRIHLIDSGEPPGWHGYVHRCWYPKPLTRLEHGVGIYVRVRGPDYLPTQNTIAPMWSG